MPTASAYLALSIVNTNTFITASLGSVPLEKVPNTGESVTINGRNFTVARVKTENNEPILKLHAPELEDASRMAHNNSTKAAIKDAPRIYEYFQVLRGEGWTVKDDAFKNRHNIKPPNPWLDGVPEKVGSYKLTEPQRLMIGTMKRMLSPDVPGITRDVPSFKLPLPDDDLLAQYCTKHNKARKPAEGTLAAIALKTVFIFGDPLNSHTITEFHPQGKPQEPTPPIEAAPADAPTTQG